MFLTITKVFEDTVLLDLQKNEIEIYEIDKFRDEIEDVLTKSLHNVIIDMGNVDYIDSSGVGVLIRLHKKLADENYILILCNLSIQTTKIFKIMNLERIFYVAQNREDSIKIISNKLHGGNKWK